MVEENSHSVTDTPFEYSNALDVKLRTLAERIKNMRQIGTLSPDTLHHLSTLFKMKTIYHSNAIEGNLLDLGETRLVVEQGLTITGKPLKDQAEARNLSEALDFLEALAKNDRYISETDIRQIHGFILKGIDDDEAGKYRSREVKISGSNFKPPDPEYLAPQMGDFSEWLKKYTAPETIVNRDPIVLASAAHAWFVQIHPFIDGNGRAARILMNLILMKAGYPIAILTKEERLRYYDALETSQVSNLSPFVDLICESVEDSLEAYELAAADQRQRGNWISDVAERLKKPELVKRQNEYVLWQKSMELLKEYFHQMINALDDAARGMYNVYFKDFGTLDLEKYLQLRSEESVKRTWFFRLDFKRDELSQRFLFFFGYGSPPIKNRCAVTLHIAKEEPPNSFNYVLVKNMQPNFTPKTVEVGYDPKAERYFIVDRYFQVHEINLETSAKEFVDDIVRIYFK